MEELMLKVGKFVLLSLAVASVSHYTTTALAATATPKPAGTTVATPATGNPATGVICQIATTGDVVHIQAVNKGTAAVPAGDSFAFTIIGPTKKTSETFTFKKDLAAGKAVNVTNAIKAASVVSCTPAA
jgi:hypothetical protein